MEFALSEDQRLFQDSARGYLDTHCPLDLVRAVAAGDAAAARMVTEAVAGLGARQMLIPAEHGGLGLGLLDAALFQEMLGRSAAPVAFTAGSIMAVVGLMAGGSPAQCTEWLPRIADGRVRIGVAVAEHGGARDGAGLRVEGGRLFGRSLFALETREATHILAADHTGRCHMVAVSDPGLTRIALTTIDATRDFAELRFDGVDPADSLAGDGAAGRMIEAGRLMLAADTLGAGQTMLERAVAYALERKQFNRVIGSFQAVKHLCADMAAQIEPARALVWHAAHARDRDMPEADVMICLAKAHLAEIGTFIARTAVEVHGGMGFTDLVGLHYWFKRIGANRQLLGGPERVRHDAARLQGWV